MNTYAILFLGPITISFVWREPNFVLCSLKDIAIKHKGVRAFRAIHEHGAI